MKNVFEPKDCGIEDVVRNNYAMWKKLGSTELCFECDHCGKVAPIEPTAYCAYCGALMVNVKMAYESYWTKMAELGVKRNDN